MSAYLKLSLWRYQLVKRLKKFRRCNLKTFVLMAALKLAFAGVYFLYKWNFFCSNLPIHIFRSKLPQWKKTNNWPQT
jgi:hypothetical protein